MALPIRKNVVKADLCNYSILLNGIGGVGKTTLFYQVTTKLYGEDGGLMINVGNEPQPNHIVNANYLQADTFKDIMEFVDELCKGRNGAYSHIKIVGFDTLDTIYDLAEDYVLEEYNNSVDGGKEVNTIKSAYGGYQAGENRVVDLVVKTLFKLRKYGYGLWINGHTKRKTKADQLGNIEYEQLTSDLPAKYYNAIKNKVNIVGTAYIRRSFDNMKQVKDVYNKGKMKTVGTVTDESRIIVFRDDDYAIDCKSHFPEICDACEFDRDCFIEAIYDAIKKELEKQVGKPISDEQMKKVQEQQQKEQKEQVEQLIQEKVAEEQKQNDEQEKERILQQLVGGYKTMSKEKKLHIKQVLTDNGVNKLQELSVEVLKTLL